MYKINNLTLRDKITDIIFANVNTDKGGVEEIVELLMKAIDESDQEFLKGLKKNKEFPWKETNISKTTSQTKTAIISTLSIEYYAALEDVSSELKKRDT